MSRRWQVEATAWAAAATLLLGLAAAVSLDRPVAAAAPTPVVVVPVPSPVALPSPSPSPSPTAKPSPRPSPVPPPPPRSAARPELDMTAVLGPPPGPQADVRPARVAAPADRYAFLVGVQNYRSPTHDTIGSAKDVRFIQSMLVQSGWKPENIRMIVDGQATGAAIRDGIAWLAAKGVPGTFTLFHYSGHVKQLGGTTEALWPVDRDFVRDTQVSAALAKVQGRMWVDLAGCEANSFVDGVASDRVLFSGSSKQSEKSYEYPPWAMSVWTGLVFDVALRQAQADADKDGRTTMGESLRYSQYYAQEITYGQRPHGRQTPQFSGAGDLGWTLADPPA